MRNVIITSVCVVCLSAIASAALAQSQLGAGSISGTVSDSNGAVISGATVMITNAGTGLVRKLTTGDSGQFSALALPVGEYAARVEKTGFATLDQIGLIVNVGGTTTLRLELKPGAANEVINIVAEQTLDAARTEETTLINFLPGSTTTRFSATNPPPLTTPIPLTRRANFGAPNNDGSQPDGTNARRFQLALRLRF